MIYSLRAPDRFLGAWRGKEGRHGEEGNRLSVHRLTSEPLKYFPLANGYSFGHTIQSCPVNAPNAFIHIGRVSFTDWRHISEE